ncbi:metal ABC transporter substrate-binding protein [Candidatus Puniceispirillum sp.]|nr:metal ABC transporter substrate-binding protein [Candidatus Puniceispirillum sp.]
MRSKKRSGSVKVIFGRFIYYAKHTIRQVGIAVSIVSLFFLTVVSPLSATEKFKAVTTFTIIADMAKNVAGNAAIVESITKPGAEIHGYSPTPRDILRAQDADLILWNGMNLELWFQQFFQNLKEIPQATLSDGIEPISIREGSYEGKPNPHAWMSLDGAMIYIDNIIKAFSTHDPENAAAYQRNGAVYKKKVKSAIAPLRQMTNSIPVDRRWLVSCEGAFSYLARDLGLNELYLWPINAERQGTPQQVRKVIDGVRTHKIPVVFCESTVRDDPARQVVRETDAVYGGALYVDSLSKVDGLVPTYIDLLKVTTSTVMNGLVKALK